MQVRFIGSIFGSCASAFHPLLLPSAERAVRCCTIAVGGFEAMKSCNEQRLGWCRAWNSLVMACILPADESSTAQRLIPSSSEHEVAAVKVLGGKSDHRVTLSGRAAWVRLPIAELVSIRCTVHAQFEVLERAIIENASARPLHSNNARSGLFEKGSIEVELYSISESRDNHVQSGLFLKILSCFVNARYWMLSK